MQYFLPSSVRCCSAGSGHAALPYRSVLVLAGCSAASLKVALHDGYEVRFEFSDVTAVVVEAKSWKKELG